MREFVSRLRGTDSGPVDRDPLPASDGHHDRIPMRVRDYVIDENEPERIVWMTTACDGPPKRVVVSRSDRGWSVKTRHPPYTSFVVSSLGSAVDGEWAETTQLNRALWHARQVMEGRTLGQLSRGNLQYVLGEKPAVEDVDAFFDAPEEDRNDPFGDYIRD